jgi:hypothetical protein
MNVLPHADSTFLPGTPAKPVPIGSNQHHTGELHMRLFITLGVIALCATACGKSPSERMAEAAISAATGQKVEVDKDGDKVTLKTDKGDMQVSSGDGATLPASFPKDVYLPSGYKVMSAMEMPNAMVIELSAPGQVSALFSDASRQMQSQGWKQTMAMQQASDTQMLAFEKENRSALVSLYGDDSGVKVGLQLAQKE